MLAVMAAVTFVVGVIMIDAMDETQKTLLLSSVKDRANYEIGMMIIQNGACAGTRLNKLVMQDREVHINMTGPCAPADQNAQEELLTQIEEWVETSYCGAESSDQNNIISCGGQDYPLHYG